MDIVDSTTRSRMMAGIRSKNTKPEMTVRRYLHARGFRYRLHARDLPGSPDLVLPKYRVAILVHGCFWHRHTRCRFATTPVSNVERWNVKFQANVDRDAKKITLLKKAGWRVMVVWECELRRLDRLAQEIIQQNNQSDLLSTPEELLCF